MIFLSLLLTENLQESKKKDLEELLVGIAKGERDAFEKFYEATKVSVYAFALSLIKNVHDAEDVMQNCYINIHRTAAQYKPQGKPMAWVLTIVKNLCFEKMRRDVRLAQPHEHSEYDETFSSQMNVEDKILVEFCLNTLTEEERKIVVLHAVSGLKHREIAKLLDLPVGTVFSKYSRAIKKIQSHLQGGEKGEQ